MSEWLKRFVFLPACAACIISAANAEPDMSLPGDVVGEDARPEAVEARSLTPPLLGAFAAPDGAMRGLAYDGEYLWAANSGDDNSLYGHKIYKLDPDSGTVIQAYNAPGTYPCGLAWDGTYLWCSAYIIGMIYQLNASTVTVERSFSAPTTHPFDLAWDGAYLYAVRGNEPLISVIDTTSGEEIDSIVATYSSSNVRPFGLEFMARNAPHLLTSDGNYGSNMVNDWNFYAGSWVDQWAADPATYPSGIAYDSVTQRLWVSCYARDSIYIYDASLVGIATAGVDDARIARIEVWPNPFSGTANIRFTIQDSRYTTQEAAIHVYDAMGRMVRSLDLGSCILDRASVVQWDGTDDGGTILPCGVYFLKAPFLRDAPKLLKIR